MTTPTEILQRLACEMGQYLPFGTVDTIFAGVANDIAFNRPQNDQLAPWAAVRAERLAGHFPSDQAEASRTKAVKDILAILDVLSHHKAPAGDVVDRVLWAFLRFDRFNPPACRVCGEQTCDCHTLDAFQRAARYRMSGQEMRDVQAQSSNPVLSNEARDLIIQLRNAIATAQERYDMIAPDMRPGEPPAADEDEDDPLREEVEEIDAASVAADAYLKSTGFQTIDG